MTQPVSIRTRIPIMAIQLKVIVLNTVLSCLFCVRNIGIDEHRYKT